MQQTLYNGETYYMFPCMVNAKEMTDDVVSQFFYEGGSTSAYTYSVQTYAKRILANSSNENMKALAKLYSASLILKSETTLRFIFKVDSSVENFTVTYNGQALEVKQRSGLYYADVVGIPAKDLDENVTVTISDGNNTAEVFFNPMAYCQGVQNDTTGAFDAEMKALVAALYLYNQAANEYFKEN